MFKTFHFSKAFCCKLSQSCIMLEFLVFQIASYLFFLIICSLSLVFLRKILETMMKWFEIACLSLKFVIFDHFHKSYRRRRNEENNSSILFKRDQTSFKIICLLAKLRDKNLVKRCNLIYMIVVLILNFSARTVKHNDES